MSYKCRIGTKIKVNSPSRQVSAQEFQLPTHAIRSKSTAKYLRRLTPTGKYEWAKQ